MPKKHLSFFVKMHHEREENDEKTMDGCVYRDFCDLAALGKYAGFFRVRKNEASGEDAFV